MILAYLSALSRFMEDFVVIFSLHCIRFFRDGSFSGCVQSRSVSSIFFLFLVLLTLVLSCFPWVILLASSFFRTFLTFATFLHVPLALNVFRTFQAHLYASHEVVDIFPTKHLRRIKEG